MANSTIKLKLIFGIDIEPEEDIIELAIFECHDYLYRFAFWAEQVSQNISPHAAYGLHYRRLVEESIYELEVMGWNHEPLADVTPELDLWLSLL